MLNKFLESDVGDKIDSPNALRVVSSTSRVSSSRTLSASWASVSTCGSSEGTCRAAWFAAANSCCCNFFFSASAMISSSMSRCLVRMCRNRQSWRMKARPHSSHERGGSYTTQQFRSFKHFIFLSTD